MAKGFGHESVKNKTVEWYTPPEIFQQLGLEFDLDPCSPGKGLSFVPARKHYTLKEDGLTQPWKGTVFLNPPYGRATGLWLEKLAIHGDGIALVFARTSTKWFQQWGVKADCLCFLSSRVRFYEGSITRKASNMPGADSMMLAYGTKAATALKQSNLGSVFYPMAAS